MRLAKWREEQDLSQAELADRLGCDQSYISRIERALGRKSRAVAGC
jgi:transcriptional regulator with XRE-family HTH domain